MRFILSFQISMIKFCFSCINTSDKQTWWVLVIKFSIITRNIQKAWIQFQVLSHLKLKRIKEPNLFICSRISHKVVFMFSYINYMKIWYLNYIFLTLNKIWILKVLIPSFKDKLCFNKIFLCNTTLKELNVQV